MLTQERVERQADTGRNVFVLVPLAVSAAVGMWGMGVPSLWRDESVSAMAATMPMRDLWRLLGDIDAVHGLYYLLLRPFAALGTGEVLLRLPSLLAMMLGAYGIAVLGRKLVSPTAGMFGGLIYAVLPIVSRYGQEARSYALVSAVAVLVTLALVHALERRVVYLLYAFGLVLLGWLHLYALLLVPAHAITVLGLRRREFVPWARAVLLAGVGIAPLAVFASGQREAQLFWLDPPGLRELAEFGSEVAGWAAVGVAVLAVLGARTRAAAWVSVPWAVTPLLSFAISQVYPVYHPRYVLFAVPAIALLAGTGLAGLKRPRVGWVVLVLVAALTVPAQLALRRSDSRPDDLRGLAATLTARELPGDAVLYVPQRFRLFVAVYGDAYRGLRDLTFAPGAVEPRTAAEFRVAARSVDRIWLVSPAIGTRWANDPRLGVLTRDFVAGSTRLFGTIHLTLYSRV